MKKKRRATLPTWPKLPTRAYGMTTSSDAVRVTALERAVGTSPLRAGIEDLDEFLEAAEPWVDRDILRAKLLAEGDLPQETLYVLAFIPEQANVIEPTGWVILPPCTVGARPARVFAIGIPRPIYSLGLEHGAV